MTGLEEGGGWKTYATGDVSDSSDGVQRREAGSE